MSDWLTKPVVTQATEEPKSIDTASEAELLAGLELDSGKQQNKERRQELKMQCLNLANRMDLSAEEIVKTAKAFYAFVRT